MSRLLIFTLLLVVLSVAPLSGQTYSQTGNNQEYIQPLPDIGVDTAGTYLWRYGQPAWRFPAFADALKDLGAEFLNDHYPRLARGGTYQQNRKNSIRTFREYAQFLEKNDLRSVWNLEFTKTERLEYKPGRNLLEAEPGLHYALMPAEILELCAENDRLFAVNYDELPHMQLSNNRFRTASGDIPALVDTTGMSLPQAYQALVKKAREVKQHYDRYGIICSTEMVWPVNQHIFARAGWTLAPKLLKESWNPVMAAMGIGAAIEYADTGADLWLTPDLWFRGNYPGHSTEELKSSLLMAHWLGVDRIYVENLDFHRNGPKHADANGTFGSLVGFTGKDSYELTPYGKVFKWYAKEYRPAHRRPYSFRQARCHFAIVRFPDSCWGARGGSFRDRLLGAKDQQSTEETEAWFKIWHLLSRKTIPPNGLSFNSHHMKGLGPRFFCPMPPVLVFDHRIGDEKPDFDFRSAKVVFVTGISVTDATLQLLEDFVQRGGICICGDNLAPDDLKKQFQEKGQTSAVFAAGKGKWIVTSDFLDQTVRDAIEKYLPPPNQMQYQFADHELILQRIGSDNDRIEVILDGKKIAP